MSAVILRDMKGVVTMKYDEALEKAKKLVEKFTVEEAVSQLLYDSPAIERLGIHEYNWWNEALHGVARAGTATVFPQAIGLAASFDPVLINRVACAISTEARAKYNQSVRFEDRDIYKGLTFWSPNINIFRDPRWGRGQETFGEDPFLTASMGCSFIEGIQGDGEFLRAAACAKHYAVHSGPEAKRHGFDAKASEKDMRETYLPAFEWAVKKAGVVGIMGAYNRTNGEPCCASSHLMGDILYGEWGFKGYFVSDCGAIADIYENHHFTKSHTESAALALKSGCDLNCGGVYRHLLEAYEEDLVSEEEIRTAASHLYAIRFMLGEFEEKRPYSDIPFSAVDCDAHRRLNIEASRDCLVLLKNENDFLPLSPTDFHSISVVGPNAMSLSVLEGNYNGHSSEYITVADGIRRVFDSSEIYIAEGSHLMDGSNLISTGKAAAAAADVTVLCLGLSPTIEGEEGSCADFEGYCCKGDKNTLRLPPIQQRLAEEICSVTDNVVVVVMAGSAVDIGEKIRNSAKAIIHAWYPGALGGLAVAQLIAGEFSPSGRLPVTFFKESEELRPFEDYSMEERTYRFYTGKPLYPFGYGLDYTDFSCDDAVLVSEDSDVLKIRVSVSNRGKRDGTHIVQLYARMMDSRARTPLFQLCGLGRAELRAGETKDIVLEVSKYWLCVVDDDGKRRAPDSGITLFAGGHQPDERSNELCARRCVELRIE